MGYLPYYKHGQCMPLDEALLLPRIISPLTSEPVHYLNHWRQRRVELRQHPIDREMVVSIGWPFDGGEPIIAEEQISGFQREIAGAKEVF